MKKKTVSVFSLRWRLSSAHLSSCRDVCPCPIFPYLKHHSKILPEKNNNKKTRYEVSLMSVSKPQVFILWLGEKLTLARTVLLHRKMVFWNYNPHAFFKTNSQGHKENTSMNNEPPVSAVCLVFRCWAEGVKKITSFGGAFLAQCQQSQTEETSWWPDSRQALLKWCFAMWNVCSQVLPVDISLKCVFWRNHFVLRMMWDRLSVSFRPITQN